MRRSANKASRGRRKRMRPRMMSNRSRTKGTQGRWWLVEGCFKRPVDETERVIARSTAMLERYGVLCREAFSSESLQGGFSRYYPVLKALEERGRVRRGFYVDTLGATQFAIPGVEERLRAASEGDPARVWLSILDPAQPYGAMIKWPVDFPIKPVRNAGNQVLISGGEVIAILSACRTKLNVREPEDDATSIQLICLLYTSPSPRDGLLSRMPSSA